MSKHILIADDDFYFRSLLDDCLKAEGFRVSLAENGRFAREAIGLEKYDLLISDVRMPEVNGLELLQWVRQNHPSLPVILVTGFSEIRETHEAAELGAKAFLPKPFKKEELLAAIHQCLQPETPVHEVDLDDDFCKVSIDDFVSGSQIPYDIFIRITNTRYVKIAYSGQDISIDRVRGYKSKGITHLYLKKPDFRKYVGMNLQIASRITHARSVETVRKVNFLRHTGELVMDKLFAKYTTPDEYDSAKTLISSSISVLSENDDMLKLMSVLNSHSDTLYAHCIGVSFISVLLSRAMGWASPSTLFKVAYGALLHDIGLKEIPREIVEKKRSERTPEEVAQFETHPSRGLEILRETKDIPTEVIQIVYQHHENCLGTGYPSHLKRSKTNPLARLVAVADEFCNLTIRSKGEPGVSPEEAVTAMVSIQQEAFDPDVIKALQKLFPVK